MLGRRGTAVALLLAAWTAAPAAALVVGLHVADHQHAAEQALDDLALATSHGHRHEAAAPAHDHEACRPSPPAAPDPAVGEAAPAERTARRVAAASWPPADPPPPTGSPPLFTSHCALLL